MTAAAWVAESNLPEARRADKVNPTRLSYLRPPPRLRFHREIHEAVNSYFCPTSR